MFNMYNLDASMLYYIFFNMLENMYGVMHLYVGCGMVALDVLSLTSDLPPLCLIGTMVGSFNLYVS